MSGGGARLVVVPTVTVLAVIKARLIGATKGHQLLKKKSDALTMQFRQILKRIVETKELMGETMKQAAFALTEAKYAAGDNIKHTVFENVSSATIKVSVMAELLKDGIGKKAANSLLQSCFSSVREGSLFLLMLDMVQQLVLIKNAPRA